MAVLFPVHALTLRTVPALAACAAGASALAFGFWAFPGGVVCPVGGPPVIVTVVEREPLTEAHPEAGTTADESRPSSPSTDVPPPPPRTLNAAVECSIPDLPTARRSPLVWPSSAGGSPMPRADGGPVAAPLSQTASADLVRFWDLVRRRVAERAVYPTDAARRRVSGQVVVLLRVDRRGNLVQTSVASPAPDRALEQAALTAVRDAAPFPPDPLGNEAATNILEALIPVQFRLSDDPVGTWGLSMR